MTMSDKLITTFLFYGSNVKKTNVIFKKESLTIGNFSNTKKRSLKIKN